MIITPDNVKEYCIVCNEVARRKDLSARSKGIYYYLATLPKKWELSQQELLRHFTEGRQSITTAFKELVNLGYIEQKRKQDKLGLFKGYTYKVNWTCQKPVNQKTEIGKPVDGKTEIGKPDTTKYLSLLNTEEVIIKEEEVLKKDIADESAQTSKPASYNRFKFLKDYFLEKYKIYPENLDQAIRDHMKVRDSKKGGKDKNSMTMYVSELEKLTGGQVIEMVEIIKNCTFKGWVGIFPKNGQSFNSKQQGRKINECTYDSSIERDF